MHRGCALECNRVEAESWPASRSTKTRCLIGADRPPVCQPIQPVVLRPALPNRMRGDGGTRTGYLSRLLFSFREWLRHGFVNLSPSAEAHGLPLRSFDHVPCSGLEKQTLITGKAACLPDEGRCRLALWVGFDHLVVPSVTLFVWKGDSGFAWYRFKIVAPLGHPQLGIHYPNPYDCYEIFVGGRLSARVSRPIPNALCPLAGSYPAIDGEGLAEVELDLSHVH